jgi:hypothetical protein
LLPITDIVAQVTGTNRLVIGFSLMPVTFAVIGNGQRLLPVTNIVVPGHLYQQIGNGFLFNARYMCQLLVTGICPLPMLGYL